MPGRLDVGVEPLAVVRANDQKWLDGELGRPLQDALDKARITGSGMDRRTEREADAEDDDPSLHGDHLRGDVTGKHNARHGWRGEWPEAASAKGKALPVSGHSFPGSGRGSVNVQLVYPLPPDAPVAQLDRASDF